jgi:hypothetical protein
MKQLRLIAPLLCVALIAFLSGCGSEKREGSSPAQVVASQACIGCHNGTNSPVTGNSVVQEWLASAHSSAPGGAGCDDCHHVDGHPGNGSIPPLPNDTVCVACHTATVAMPTQAAHFSNLSASYLGLPLARLADTLINTPFNASNPAGTNNSSSSCNGCHNPHDMSSLLSVNHQWAQSGHADTNDDAFREQNFLKNTTCNRCHSASGFRYYVTNAQTAVTVAQLGRYSSAKEVISCPACHTNYSWRRISSDPAVTSFINFSTPYPKYPNVTKRIPGSTFPSPTIGDSKLCIPCHAGRTGNRVGPAITLAATATAPFDSHYFPAAAVMYGKIAFIDFTSQAAALPAVPAIPASTGVQPTVAIAATTYGQSLITSEDRAGGVTSTHRKLGTTAINGDSHNPAFFTPGHLDANGPCVVCHMTAGHTLNFENPVINTATYNQVCINCHTSERGTPLNANNFMEAFVDENRAQMFDALDLGINLLQQRYNISINLSDDEAQESPQDVSFVRFSDGAALTGATWTNYLTTAPPGFSAPLTPTQVYKLKGALFNIIVCFKDNAAFLHARTLTRRIIYDALDYLDDGLMNQSVGATAQAQSLLGNATTNPVFGKFVKDTRAFITDTSGPLFGATTPSMTYIIGFDRTTGSWTPPQRERP